MELTIIIPIHNSEKYLKECMESALSQDFHDMEILCIDSDTDASFSIIEKLRKKDSRIRYIPAMDTRLMQELRRLREPTS